MEKNRNPRSYHLKFANASFCKETLEGTWDEKRGTPDVTIQSSQLQVFEKKAMKGKVDEKSRNPRSTIQSSFSLVLCHGSCAKL